MTRSKWIRSPLCSGNGDCVEVGMVADEVLVRDSKEPTAQVLRFSRPEWAAFVAATKTGHFDLADPAH